MERLHKFLAHCGIASRRKAEEWILEGRVAVNGETITELGVKIDPLRDRITVDGKPVQPEKKVYYLLHKPRGITTTTSDEYGRKTVLDLLEGVSERVYPVGRLDRESEGLLVLTNDGALAYYLTHPRCGVKKTYQVVVEGEVDDATIATLVEKGIYIGPVRVQPLALRLLRRDRDSTKLEITVGEGINREVRRLFAVLGHEVKKLVRIQIGPLSLEGIPRGHYRPMTYHELRKLREGMKGLELGGEETGSSTEREKSHRERGTPSSPRHFSGRLSSKRKKMWGKPDPAIHAGKGRRWSSPSSKTSRPPSSRKKRR